MGKVMFVNQNILNKPEMYTISARSITMCDSLMLLPLEMARHGLLVLFGQKVLSHPRKNTLFSLSHCHA